jgi:hypothetical protein
MLNENWQKFSFAGLQWRINPAEAKRLLETRGYIYNGTQFDGGLAFGGSLYGTLANVFPDFNDAKELIGVAVVIPCGELSSAKTTFDRLRTDLSRKYGEPSHSFKNFLENYHEGADNEVEGFRRGSIIFASGWSNDTEEGDESIRLNINQHLDVQIHYDFDDWSFGNDDGDL